MGWAHVFRFICKNDASELTVVGTAMMPQYYNAGQTPWGIYLATPVAPQTPQATPPGQPAAPMLRGQHAVSARPMTPIQTATPLDDSSTPQMHPTPGTLNFQGSYASSNCDCCVTSQRHIAIM